MQDNFFLILGLAGLTGAVWLLWNVFKTNPEPAAHKGSTSPVRASGPLDLAYAAVSIHCSGTGCQAVSAIQGRRFLGAEAPGLPLADCSSPHCNCSYLHHDDRRHNKSARRLFVPPTGEEDPMFVGMNDQRRGMGRRASDWELAYQLNVPAA